MRAVASAIVVIAALAVVGCASRDAITQDPSMLPRSAVDSAAADRAPAEATRDEGLATWYGKGKKTANGEHFDPSAMTAAHRTLKFGTWVEVTRLDTGATVRVRITDRGPFGDDDRIIDLTRGAAAKIGMLRAGVVKVKLRIVGGP